MFQVIQWSIKYEGVIYMNVEKMKHELIKQKESQFKGNIYHFSQVNFSYNSNKIEGSRLTEDQTEAIFDTSSFIPKSNDDGNE